MQENTLDPRLYLGSSINIRRTDIPVCRIRSILDDSTGRQEYDSLDRQECLSS
jgi:hypothetical protein